MGRERMLLASYWTSFLYCASLFIANYLIDQNGSQFSSKCLFVSIRLFYRITSWSSGERLHVYSYILYLLFLFSFVNHLFWFIHMVKIHGKEISGQSVHNSFHVFTSFILCILSFSARPPFRFSMRTACVGYKIPITPLTSLCRLSQMFSNTC